MKKSGTCPKCKSRAILTGGDGTQHMDMGGIYEYTTYVCAGCGLEERYMHERVIEYRLAQNQLQQLNAGPGGPFR